MRNLFCFLALLWVTASVGWAQNSRATVIGRTVDPSGAIVVGANVQAVNIATNTVVATKSNEGGNYEIPYLLPGIYNVSVEMAGFKKAVRDGIQLRIGDRLTLDFVLDLGNVAESVVVTGETPLLETASADMGLVMDTRKVAELPVVGGNPFYLARLTAGVLASGVAKAEPYGRVARSVISRRRCWR